MLEYILNIYIREPLKDPNHAHVVSHGLVSFPCFSNCVLRICYFNFCFMFHFCQASDRFHICHLGNDVITDHSHSLIAPLLLGLVPGQCCVYLIWTKLSKVPLTLNFFQLKLLAQPIISSNLKLRYPHI